MTYLARELITRSWYLSGIVARRLETVNGDQITDGLFLLNSLLDVKASDIRLIPYFTRYTFNMITGQEKYEIDNLYAIETMTFNIGPVRYPMSEANRDKYFGSGRVDNIQSIPFEYFYERRKGGSDVYVYYLPMGAYVANISGKFALTDVTLITDMQDLYDGFYLEYLRYALAQFMCDEYNISFAPEKIARLRMYEKKLVDVSPPDLTIQKIQILGDKTSINWAQVNIGKGFTV